ncbi:MAG TPA: tetratricopeptide repeat protein [Candidatus Sulfomarinibacteraceae bacterium]|nr:tetratricopeptide repeat protein [Candidatus Sulfomarinibacteraceae bacterium]
MPNRKSTIVCLLLVLVVFTGMAEAIRQGRLVGLVEDPEGNPIEGVTVRATSEQVPGYDVVEVTDKKGVFKLDFEEIDVVYTYVFSKPGYVTLRIDQTWQKVGTARDTFVLTPGDDAVVGDAVLVTGSSEAATAYNAGVAAFDDKDYATAEARFAEAVSADPELRQAWAALSLVSVEQKHYEKAVEAAERAIELGSTDPMVMRSRWEAYRQLGDEAKAAEAQADLERIGELAEEAKRIYNEGVQLLKDGDKETAFARFNEALGADPNLQEAQFAVAMTGIEIGRNQEALDAAREILKEDPDNADALRLRYNAALALNDPDLVADALVDLAPIEPAAAKQNLWLLAMSAYDANDMASAERRFKNVLQVDPTKAQAHYLLGLIYLGRPDAQAETRQHLERFLELAPDDPDAPAARDILQYLESQS